MPNIDSSNVPFIVQNRITHNRFTANDSYGRKFDMIIASAQFLPENHSQKPRFDIRTRAMLVVPKPNRTYKPIWEARLSSEVDNTESYDPIPLEKFNAVKMQTKTYHPLRSGFVKQMEQIAFEHHQKHKDDVAITMAGMTVQELISLLDD